MGPGGGPRAAGADHADEPGSHRYQVRNLLVDIRKMCPRDGIDRRARRSGVVGQREQFAHSVDRKPKAAAAADKREAQPVGFAILSATRWAPHGLSQQALFFVKPDSCDLGSGGLTELADAQIRLPIH